MSTLHLVVLQALLVARLNMMSTLHLVVLQALLVTCLLHSSSGGCGEDLTTKGPKVRALISRRFPSCRDVDFTSELPICELGEDDGRWSTPNNMHPTLPACPGGTWNRTCYPAPANDVIYDLRCVCHSSVHVTADVRATYWSDVEELSVPVNGAPYTRRLMMEGEECIAQEYIKAGPPLPIGPIITDYTLPDSIFTASSSYDGNYVPYKARLDNYFAAPYCGWISGGDSEKWLGITLPDTYMVTGLVVERKCHTGEYLTVTTVTTSSDGVTWQDVLRNEAFSGLYDADYLAYIWFAQSYISRHWRIYRIGATSTNPRIKVDLMGRPMSL